jgi:hypothetical protein
MRTAELAAHLDVSYRQLDYLVGRPGGITSEDLGVTPGSGNRRVWPGWIIARLEVATKLAKLMGDVTGCAAWPALVDRVLAYEGDIPATGWALLDDLGDVHIAPELPPVLDRLRKAGGGLFVCFALSPIAAGVLT